VDEGLAVGDFRLQHVLDGAPVGAEVRLLNGVAADGEKGFLHDLADAAQIAGSGGNEYPWGHAHGARLLAGRRADVEGEEMIHRESHSS
jgi:hypothetical protein